MPTTTEQERFGIEQLFGSKTRTRLLQLFLKQPNEAFFVRELTRKIDAQLNSVRRELSNLVSLGLIKEKEGGTDEKGKVDRRKFYSVNTDFSIYDELRALFLKAGAMIQQDLVRSLIIDQPIQVMVLTGKFVGKDDTETDILIVGTPDPKSLKARVEDFEATLGHELNYTVMPPDEYLYRKEISDRFLMELLQSDNVILHDSLA
jgi:predicted transcriptional regulator